jgi:predicted transcriptional regulator
MPATSLKLTDVLKARVATIAQNAGMSPHAFMVDAIERQARLAELRGSFVEDALASRAEAHETGKAYAAADVHDYMEARARGEAVKRPAARKWRK